MSRAWSVRERAPSLFWCSVALALIPFAYFDPSVHSVAGLLKAIGVVCVLVGFALSPSMFFEPLSSLKTVPKPAMRGLFCFLMFAGVGSGWQLVSNVINAF